MEGGKNPKWDKCSWSFTVIVPLQLCVAMVPVILDRDWSILLMTGLGTALAVVTGSLRELVREKYECRKDDESKKQDYILTRGNGHNHVFVIQANDYVVGLNLNDLAGARRGADTGTRVLSVILAILWIVFLVVAGGLDVDTWYLLAVGALGMMQNVFVAGWQRSTQAHGIPLEFERIFGQKDKGVTWGQMRTLREFANEHPGAACAIRPEFFPDHILNLDEKQEWKHYAEEAKRRREALKAQAEAAKKHTK